MGNYLNEIFNSSKNSENENLKNETKIILECAPLIFGLRLANIINITRAEFVNLKKIFFDSDLSFYVISTTKDRLSLLFYRKNNLSEYFSKPKTKELLEEFGYDTGDMYGMMYTFSLRYRKYINKKADFPHEMGLFLGYPVEDVEGYINNDGKNSLAVGYWKVYEGVNEKIKLFEKFEEAKETLTYLVYKGMNINEIVRMFYYRRNVS